MNRLSMDFLDELIRELAQEQDSCHSIVIPDDLNAKRKMMRTLMSLRPPLPIPIRLIELQDIELGRQLSGKGIVQADLIQPTSSDVRIKIWQGDITRLKVDAIVNAANSSLLGCFIPLHDCIDNAIHSAAGMQLRLECHELMQDQGHEEPSGTAKMTRGYNLPANYVIHTVGPVISGSTPTQRQERQLAMCYQSCMSLASANNLTNIAFCCISTGEFHFPNRLAAEIAVRTVKEFMDLQKDTSIEYVVFNVFKDLDYAIYKELLFIKG